MTERLMIEALDALYEKGSHVDLWLRDDDCTVPSDPLDVFLSTVGEHGLPVTLAVIPEPTGNALVERLKSETNVLVAVHGWSHVNHAPAGVKKCELGEGRPIEVVEHQLREGLSRLAALHGGRFVPMLVPPWNRIAADVVAILSDLGYHSLSTFGAEKPAPLPVLNTHVDVIDWRNGRCGRNADALFAEIAGLCRDDGVIGILTHHLVHDAAVENFLKRLFALTAGHPACRWMSSADLLARRLPALPSDQKT